MFGSIIKDCERRFDQTPMMSGLARLWRIRARDADMIIMIYRNGVYYPNDDESKGMADLLIRKKGTTGLSRPKFKRTHLDLAI